MPPDNEQLSIRDEERHYWTQVPNILWELGLPLYAWALYIFLKRRAGDHGESFQSTRRIAKTTGISRGSVQRGMELLERVRLIRRTLKKREGNTNGWRTWHVSIVDIWPQNMARFRKEKQATKWVTDMQQRITKTVPGGGGLQSVPGGDETVPQQTLKKIPEEKPKERGVKEDAINSPPPLPPDTRSVVPLRGENARPKSVSPGTGDPQTDAVNARADTSKVQARDLVAREIYRVMARELDYPDGRSKYAKDSRRPYELVAEKILERIGRANYAEALDACHLLLTEPTEGEEKWIAEARTPHGLIDTVTKRVSQLRGAARSRAAAIERNKLIETIEVSAGSFVNIGPIVNIGADVPHEYADIWREVLEDMELQSGRPDTLLRCAVLQEVTEDTWTIELTGRVSMGWAQIKLKPAVERTLALVAGRPMQVSFVARNGVGIGNQDED